jgi:hypothetical protein
MGPKVKLAMSHAKNSFHIFDPILLRIYLDQMILTTNERRFLKSRVL